MKGLKKLYDEKCHKFLKTNWKAIYNFFQKQLLIQFLLFPRINRSHLNRFYYYDGNIVCCNCKIWSILHNFATFRMHWLKTVDRFYRDWYGTTALRIHEIMISLNAVNIVDDSMYFLGHFTAIYNYLA